MSDLKGLCKNCLGCNRLEMEDFEGVEECEYATERQITIEEVMND